jgi:hypothetical protein
MAQRNSSTLTLSQAWEGPQAVYYVCVERARGV